jgi:hypothetical protein
MGKKIMETSNTKMFELLNINRDVDKIEFLMALMAREGWCDAYPLNCYQLTNGKLVIKDGHHRFEAACNLGIPIKYVVCNDGLTIYEIDRATQKWDMADFMNSYSRGGSAEYEKVREYCKRTGISIACAMPMMTGAVAGGTQYNKKFKTGGYECKDTSRAEVIADIVQFCKNCNITWAHNNRLVMALSRMSFVDGFSANRLKKKIGAYPHMVTKRPHVEGYMEMIDEIYNYKSKNADKVPLKFLADKETRERSDRAKFKKKEV